MAEIAAIKKGVKITGNFLWSSIDTDEWMLKGKYYFGLIELNRKSGERNLRKSAQLYGEIARAKSIDLQNLPGKFLTQNQQDLLERYLVNGSL